MPYGDSRIAPPTDYGMIGVATPGEVADARREDAEPQLDDNSVVGSRINQIMGPAAARMTAKRELSGSDLHPRRTLTHQSGCICNIHKVISFRVKEKPGSTQ